MDIKKAIIQSAMSGNGFLKFYFDTLGIGSEFKPLDVFFTYSVTYSYFHNCWFFVMMQKGGNPYNRTTTVYKVSKKLEIIESYNIPTPSGVMSVYDEHLKVSIKIDDNTGKLHLLREKGKNSTGLSDGHNTDYLYYLQDDENDLSSIYLKSTSIGRWSYPKLWVSSLGVPTLGGRGNSTTQLDEWAIHLTSDGGVNWDFYTVINTNLGDEGRAYVQEVYNHDNDEYIISLNIRKDSLGAFEGIHILRSDDGLMWFNYDKTFSKKVDTLGAITKAELDSNFLVWQKADDDHAVNYEGAHYINGEIKLLLSGSVVDDFLSNGNVYQTYEELRYYTFDNGWVYKDLTSILPKYYGVWGHERTVQLCWSDESEYITILDKMEISQKSILKEYKSLNGFISYNYKKLDSLDGNIFLGSHSINSNTDKNRLLILTDIQGDYNSFNSSGNLILYKPE